MLRGLVKVLTTILRITFLPTLQHRVIVKIIRVCLHTIAVFLEDLYGLRSSHPSQLTTEVITQSYDSSLVLVPDDVLVKEDILLQRMETVKIAVKE